MNKFKILALIGMLTLPLSWVHTEFAKADEFTQTQEYSQESDICEVESSGIINPIDVEAYLQREGFLVSYSIPKPEKQVEKCDDKEVTDTEYTKADDSIKGKGKTFKCTAYCNCSKCCGKYSPECGGKGTTFTGTIPKEGRTIAVDPDVIPLGSKVVINGNVYIAEDRGGAIKGNRIDIYFSSHDAANSFGVKYLKVQVLK